MSNRNPISSLTRSFDASRRAEIETRKSQLHVAEAYHLDAEESVAFVKALKAPPKPSSALCELMATKSPWE